jgi:hypothetical protein
MNPQEKQDAEFVSKDKDRFMTLPGDRRTESVSLAAIEVDPDNIRYVPENILNEKLMKKALQGDGLTLEYIPDNMKTSDLCNVAVENSGWALQFVPEEMKTEQMCRRALHSAYDITGEGIEVLAFIPYPDVCMHGIKLYENSMVNMMDIYGFINPQIMTAEMAMYGVKDEPGVLGFIPEHLHSYELRMEAVKGDGMRLYNIPDKDKTMELCEAAINSTFHSLRYVPDEMKTTELCNQALKKDAFAIQYFPADKLTHEVCLEAVNTASHPRILSFIPFEDIHLKVFNEQCKDYSTTKEFLENMKPDYIKQDLAYKIFEKQPELFYNIPIQFKDKQLCEAAVKRDGSYLAHILESQKTKELCELAIKSSPYAIPYILDEMKGEEQYRKMVKDNPKNLIGIPYEDRTDELCRIALDNTFGKDKNDFSVVNSVTSSQMLLEVFKAHTNPEKVDLLLHIVSHDLITPEIAKDALQKSGRSFHVIPQKAWTPEVAETAVKSDPSSLGWVPSNMRTADMILFTKKAIEGYNINIPEEISKGDNIYTFHKRVENIINKPLSYDQHKQLYNGESIRVKDIQTSNGFVKIGELRYDAKSKNLNVKSVEQTTAEKQKNSIQINKKPDRKGKGRKI